MSEAVLEKNDNIYTFMFNRANANIVCERKFALSTKNLTCCNAGKLILDRLNFSMERGEIAGIVGLPKSVKTAFMKIISGIKRDYTGTVEINGHDLNRMKLAQIYYSIGYVPQRIDDYFFLPYVAEEIALATKGITINEHDFTARILLELGIAEVLGLPTDELTVRQKGLLALASAILRGRHLVLLDQCLEQFDDQLEIMKNLLREALKRGTSVLITGDSVEFLANFTTKIYLLADGRIKRLVGN